MSTSTSSSASATQLPFSPTTRFGSQECDPYGYTQDALGYPDATRPKPVLVSGVDWREWWRAGQPPVSDWLNTQGAKEWIRLCQKEDSTWFADHSDHRTLATIQFACNNLAVMGYKCKPTLAAKWTGP